jgi:hypothetical protein
VRELFAPWCTKQHCHLGQLKFYFAKQGKVINIYARKTGKELKAGSKYFSILRRTPKCYTPRRYA